MRKICLCVLALLLLLTGCASKPPESRTAGLKITTTIFPPYDFVRQIAGDKADISMLVPPGSESHGFVPTLADLSAIQKSDLLLYAGDDSDAWVETLNPAEYSTTKMLALGDMVTRPAAQDEEDGHTAEHLWTSVRNAMQMVKGISAALCGADPGNAAYYQKNTEKYLQTLQQLDADFAAAVAAAPLKTLVFAERFPFASFAEDYGLQWHAAFDHCSADFEPKIDVIQDLITLVRTQKIPVVFYIEFSNQTVADTICAATGCQKALFHSCHNVTKQEFAANATYLSLMQNNLTELRKALYYAA